MNSRESVHPWTDLERSASVSPPGALSSALSGAFAGSLSGPFSRSLSNALSTFGLSRVALYEGWLDEETAAAAGLDPDEDTSLPSEALSQLRAVLGEFDLDEYQVETDFLNFVYGLRVVGVLSRDQYKQITDRVSPPFEIGWKWLEENPLCDKQGIPWIEGGVRPSYSVLSSLQNRRPTSRSATPLTGVSEEFRDTTSLYSEDDHAASAFNQRSLEEPYVLRNAISRPSSPGFGPGPLSTTSLLARSLCTPRPQLNDMGTGFEGARRCRQDTYRSHFDVCKSWGDVAQFIDPPFAVHDHFQFLSTFTTPRPHLSHFQLRNLVCPVDKNCIYYTESDRDMFRVKRLNPELGRIENIIVAEHMDSNVFMTAKFSALDADEDFFAAGGFSGQYLIKRIDSCCPITESDGEEAASKSNNGLACGIITTDSQGITNHVSLHGRKSRTPNRIVFASNDCTLRTLDIATDTFIHTHSYPWPVNCTAYNPVNSKLMVMVGDTTESFIRDTETNQEIAHLSGHKDYGFACAWSPDGNIIATGNQDGTCRIYDARNTSKSLHVISTRLLAAIRCMTFDSSGRFLAFSEPIDYVTILDTRTDFQEGQIVEMWGDIAGLGFSSGVNDDGQYLTIGNCDRFVGGILQYEQKDYEKFIINEVF